MTSTGSLAVQSFDPRTGKPHADTVPITSDAEVGAVLVEARTAFAEWSQWTPNRRASALDAVAEALDAAVDELVALADSETALGSSRLVGEVARTSGQLRLFADVVREGSFVGATISPASPPAQPDVRRMLLPVGTVAVFSASNFPFAFSVVGGDTASALAAGCSVVVKAHEGHPRTSARTFEIVRAALEAAGAPDGLLGIVYGRSAGVTLVRHPAVRAVGFTGSLRGGRALFDLAAGRPDPVPFYGELGSVNPVVVLPAAGRLDGSGIADGYAASLTMGNGQFCTNPGLVFVPNQPELLAAIGDAISSRSAGAMLTAGMRDAYLTRTRALDEHPRLASLASGTADSGSAGPADGAALAVQPRVYQLSLEAFAADSEVLSEECFGPAGLVVTYSEPKDLLAVLEALPGSLTASVHAAPADHQQARDLATVLQRRVGRLIFNGWPTGVAVCWAMHHGGPWPATTAAGFTSVGARAIDRWLIPIAFQGWPDQLLPEALQADNPLRIVRRINESLES